MLPDVPAIDREFDYVVPPAIGPVAVGDVVRIVLHGRRVGGWVVATDVDPTPGIRLLSLAKRSGVGPSAELIDLAAWAAHRFAGRRATFLRTAAPPTVVPRITPVVPSATPVPVALDPAVSEAFQHPCSVLRLPPTADRMSVALAAAARGQALLLVPTVAAARRLAMALRRAGVQVALHPRDWASAAGGATVVGTRAAAWAPAPDLAAVVVFDEHDETWQEERAPTWHARDVAVERARRAGAPCLLVSPTPSLEALGAGPLSAPSRSVERAGWPLVDIVDRRRDDPMRGGLWSERVVPMLREGEHVVCVLNRTGRSRLLACGSCGEVTRCESCEAAVVQAEAGLLRCRRCETERPVVCQRCGGTALRNIRAGVTRAREELEALVGEPVVEVTATTEDPVADARVHIGTEAVLHRVTRATTVIFLDMDQELLAPRYRAGEQAMALLVHAARSVGARAGGGRVVVQTRVPHHEVLQAALLADPARFAQAEADRRAVLRMPPVVALAEISGAAADQFVASFTPPPGVEVLGPADGRYLVRAPDHVVLSRALADAPRPSGRLRLAVDPLRV
ncbi:MAG: primosomal protein N' family DNA-binding protein [Acidimicrobiales bacterium]